MKFNRLVIVFLSVLLLVPGIAAAASDVIVTVKIDGKAVYFPDAKPYVESNRVLIPIRFVSESLGGKVDYKDRTVTITQDNKKIVLKIDSKVVSVDGKNITLDVPARAKQSRTYVPLRFVSEVLGAQVNYANKVVTITTAKQPGTDGSNGSTDENTNAYKPFEIDTKYHDLAPLLFENNMRVEGNVLVFKMPELKDRTDGYYSVFGKDDVILKAGQEYRFKLGESGYIVVSYAHADENIEAYFIYLNPKDSVLEGQFDSVKGDVVVVNSHPTSSSSAGTLTDVVNEIK